MKLRLREVSPNPYNSKIFEESLHEASIADLAESLKLRGLQYPIIVTKVGRVILDGERRYLAAKKLRWDTIEVTEVDVPKNEILDRVLEFATSQRQMTLLEQARVYEAYFKHLKTHRDRQNMTLVEAKRVAMKKAGLPFRSVALADQLTHVVNRGDADLHEKLLSGGASITALYEKLERRTYGYPAHDNPPLPVRLDVPPEPPPPTTPGQRATRRAQEQARRFERAERREEQEFTTRYVEAHHDELREKDAQDKLVQLYEPEPPPAAKKYPENEVVRVLAEALEALAVREPPEQVVGRLGAFIEEVIDKVKEVDEQRSRDIVREVFKPMVLRIGRKFPRTVFELPVGDESDD